MKLNQETQLLTNSMLNNEIEKKNTLISNVSQRKFNKKTINKKTKENPG